MLRCLRSWLAWLLPALLLLLASPASAGAPRLALVVGNAAYPARPLATVANDAALVAQALAQAGFDVTAARDLDGVRLRATLAAFLEAARAAGPDATIFVYLAGYGVQYTGRNFFMPVDARLVHDDDVPSEAASLDDFIRALAAVPAKARLVVLDASRPQPFATADETPLAPGLGATVAPTGTIVAFAAAPGMVSPDDALPYGAYARALAEAIAAPGLSPNVLFDRVRLRVGMLTNGEQAPWDDGAIADSVALTAAVAPAAPAPATPPPPGGGLSPEAAYSVVVARDTLASYAEFLRIVPDGSLAGRIRVLQAVRREALIWQAAAASDDPRADWTYMRRYPRGPHRFDARRRLAALHAALEPPPRFDPFIFPALPPPTPAELALVAAPEQALRGLSPIPPPQADLLPPADPAYYDELPMPAPALAGLLPIAPPLPGAAGGEPGRIHQTPQERAPTVSETQLAPNGSGTITLADAAGPIAELAAGEAVGDMRTLVETGPANAANSPVESTAGQADSTAGRKTAPLKAGPPVLSRTSVSHAAEGVTIVQTGADGTALLEIATRADTDGFRTTRVTNGDDQLLASWRRDAQGVVVARAIAPIAGGAMAAQAPVPARPSSRVAPAQAPAPAPSGATSPPLPTPLLPAPPAVPPAAPTTHALTPPVVAPLKPVPVRPVPAPVAAPAPAPAKPAPAAPPLQPVPVRPAPVPTPARPATAALPEPSTAVPAPEAPAATQPQPAPAPTSTPAPLPPSRPSGLAPAKERKATNNRRPPPARRVTAPRRRRR